MSTLFLHGIGLLVTNDPDAGLGSGAAEAGADPRDGEPGSRAANADERLGIIRDAALIARDGEVVWVGRQADAAPQVAQLLQGDVERIDAGGRAVIPGFVDSHTHIAFAGDRSDEFVARMAGERYAAGGIRSTMAATRAASDEQLRATLRRFERELASQGTTTFEVKTGYGLDLENEERLARLAAEVTDEVTFLGAHVVPPEFADDRDGYVDLVAGAMLDACAPHSRWIDVFCEEGAFTAHEAARILAAGRARGLGARIHAGQLHVGDGVRVAVDAEAASVDHATYLSDDDVAALAGSDTVCTLLPGVEFSTRHPYPDARALLNAGVTLALASDCNPGSCFTSSMPFVIALAVRELGMTPDEALWAATAGGAKALRRDDVGRLSVGASADLVLLDAPSHVFFAYRPGVPLVRRVWKHGVELRLD